MATEDESNLELIGIRPAVVAFFMIIFSVFIALGVLPLSIFYIFTMVGGEYLDPMFLDDYLFFAYSPFILIPLNILNIAYIWKLVRYYRGDSTSFSVFWIGLFSVILPTVWAIMLIRFMSTSQTVLAISPIFLPFIAGLILMHTKPGPELISPWQGDPRDGSWWNLKKPDWWERLFPLSEKNEKGE